MRGYLKIAAVLVVAILVLSSVYIVFFAGPELKKIETVVDYSNWKNNETENGGNNGGQKGFTHTVFIEEGTATWCENCPNVAGILNEIYDTGNYNFYYVSMIDDMNAKAHSRLYTDYNVYGFPTVFIDGGYQVILGGNNEKSVYENAIRKSESRNVPNVKATVKSEYDNTKNEITTNVLVENNDSGTYKGYLKVYLTEIISRWVNPYKASDGNTKPYHFGFIDYIMDQEISVDGMGNNTVTNTKNLSDFAVTDLAPENLMIIAVVFNSKSVNGYANPDSNENPFNAYYADAANATVLIPGGNLPPTVGISSPEAGMLNLFGKPVLGKLYKNIVSPVLKTLLNRTITILIGKTTIVANAEDDSGIARVEFYIDGKLKFNDTEAPYEYSFKKIGLIKHLIRRHTLTVIAYDNEGKTATASLDVLTFLL